MADTQRTEGGKTDEHRTGGEDDTQGDEDDTHARTAQHPGHIRRGNGE